MAHPRKRRGSRKGRKDIIGIALIVISVALVITGTYMYYHQKSGRVPIDKDTLCPEGGPTEITVALIDRTDLMNTVQQACVRNHLDQLREKIPVGGQFVIYSVGPTQAELLRPNSKCATQVAARR